MNDAGAPQYAVLDLDGVLADTRHRLHHLTRRGPKRWEAFFAAADADPVHPEGRAVVEEVTGRGLEVVYLSGRPERTRAATVEWLARHDLPAATLLLRPDEDRRAASAVKLGHLRALARTGTVTVLVDDDPDVVGVVRRSGLAASVLLATWQPRDAATASAQGRAGRT